ncbi:MAG: flavodoxin family protein [Bacteroidetes bacterium]|nr:MAG: flavodoxin family protein [Bacteroidota bacterium]
MKVLIIYSNHHEGNFNWQLLEKLKDSLLHNGHELVVRDLYQLDFDPVLRTKDFEMISSGNIPADIEKEQSFVSWADAMIFIYPVWWGGMPAIVKGYIDKVFSWGFAYKSNGKGVYPLLTGKNVIVMNSLGQSRSEYEKGMFQAMNLINVEGVFGFCGINVASQLYFSSIHNITEQEKEDYLNQALNAVKELSLIISS